MDTMMADRVIPGMQSPARQRRSQPRLSAGLRPHGLATGELVKLHHALTDALPAGAGVVTQLVAPEPDVSITHVAYDLAYISASWLDKRVLFVDGTGMRTDAIDTMLPSRLEPMFSASFDPSDLEASISRVVGLELYQMSFPTMRGALDLAPVLRRIPEFMDRLRQTFDLVIIASPSAAEAPMGVLLAPYVDGSVLVLESGRTRGPVAAKLRDALRASGGSVIGVVLTKCRRHAPRWLHRWL
jgi:Mrp family chromosome partitioning ATPase